MSAALVAQAEALCLRVIASTVLGLEFPLIAMPCFGDFENLVPGPVSPLPFAGQAAPTPKPFRPVSAWPAPLGAVLRKAHSAGCQLVEPLAAGGFDLLAGGSMKPAYPLAMDDVGEQAGCCCLFAG